MFCLRTPTNFLKAVFHKFYLVHFRILCLIQTKPWLIWNIYAAWKFIAKCKCTYDSCRRNVLNQLFYERHLVNNEREMTRGECPKLYLKGDPKNKWERLIPHYIHSFTIMLEDIILLVTFINLMLMNHELSRNTNKTNVAVRWLFVIRILMDVTNSWVIV